MIKTTRLATEKEKSIIIAYINQDTVETVESSFFTWSDTSIPQQQYDWSSASFVVLEVKGMEDKIVIVNRISTDSSDALDITTGHYLLSVDNHVMNINY